MHICGQLECTPHVFHPLPRTKVSWDQWLWQGMFFLWWWQKCRRASLSTQAHFKDPACIISTKILLVEGGHMTKLKDKGWRSTFPPLCKKLIYMVKCEDWGRGEESESVIQSTVVHFLGHIYSCPSYRKYPYLKDPEKSHSTITSGCHGTPEINTENQLSFSNK